MSPAMRAWFVSRALAVTAALVALDNVQDQDEATRLAVLEARGLLIRPRKRSRRKPFQGPTVPARGKLASEMVIEDRR